MHVLTWIVQLASQVVLAFITDVKQEQACTQGGFEGVQQNPLFL